MEFFRRSWLQTRAFADQLTSSQKWLMFALLIILGLSGLVILPYATQQSLVPITGFADRNQSEVISRLEAGGIHVKAQQGQIYVPASERLDAISILQTSELLNEDTSVAFDALIKNHSPWMSNEQNRQAYMLALRKTLGMIIGRVKGVASADVFVAQPQDVGFGSTYVKPTASVNLIMEKRRPVDKKLAQAIAALVAGSIAELMPGDVTIIDANFGHQFSGTDDDGNIAPSETFEFLKAQEVHYRTKILEALGYIPGVRIAVNVRNDPVLRKDIQTYAYEKSERLTMQESKDLERKSMSDRGEPGVRPNTSLSIAGGRQSGTTETIAEARSEFGSPVMTERVTSHEIGQTVTQVNVTVNIPRRYFVSRLKYRQGVGADVKEPTEEEIQQEVARELPQIEAQVQPLIAAASNKGIVKAHMIPDSEMLMAGLSGTGTDSGLVGVMKSRWAGTAMLGGLALLAVGVMFSMVRKSLRHPTLPSVEELAGIPPTLPSEDDLIGEVEAVDTGMEGVEVNEAELQVRQLAEQISEMVRANPAEAASLFNRWVESDD